MVPTRVGQHIPVMAADLFTKYICTYCQDDITGLRVKCIECTDFELCLQCFSAGAEIGPHKNDHSYQFVDSVALDVFRDRSGWSAREELHLLNAIEHYSFGNWKDISQHIATRTPDEAREEYINRFLEGSIGRVTWPQAATSRPCVKDLTAVDSGPLSPRVTSHLPPLDITPEEAAQLDYMPLRDDFETEYDNDAEVLVSSLSVNSEDDDLDTALKLAQVDMYTHRLRERARRKRMVRDYQLVSQFFAGKDKPKKKLSRDEKELEEKLRSFCQFHTAQEHEQFMNGLMRQRELSRRLSELLRYRRNGLTKFEELPHFEQERVARHNASKSGSSASTPPPRLSVGIRKKEKNGEGSYSVTANSTLASGTAFTSNLATQGSQPDSESASQPSYHLLSASEKQLCTNLEITPTQYISMKTLMLSEPLMKTETVEEQQVQDHLINSGWVMAS